MVLDRNDLIQDVYSKLTKGRNTTTHLVYLEHISRASCILRYIHSWLRVINLRYGSGLHFSLRKAYFLHNGKTDRRKMPFQYPLPILSAEDKNVCAGASWGGWLRHNSQLRATVSRKNKTNSTKLCLKLHCKFWEKNSVTRTYLTYRMLFITNCTKISYICFYNLSKHIL